MSLPRSLRPWLRTAVRAIAYRLIALYGRLTGAAHSSSSGQPERFLLIRLDLLGDVLFSMQGVEQLRAAHPDAYIAVLVLPYTAPLARLYSSVDEVITVDTNRIRSVRGLLDPRTWLAYWTTVQLLRARQFDVAVSLSGQMASLWAHLSGAPRSVGYADEAYPNLLTDSVPGGRFTWRIPDVMYVSRLIETLGPPPIDSSPVLPVPDRAAEAGRNVLCEWGIDTSRPLVLVHAGAMNGSAKRWPAANWSRFIDDVASRSGAQVVLVGAAGDAPLTEDVRRSSATAPVSLAGKTDIEALIGVIASADLLASGDSGPLHLAAAVGIPTLAVFGPNDPRVHGPFRPAAGGRLLRADIVCSPCYSLAATAECPLGDPICMRLVTPEPMVQAALELLHAVT